MEPSKMEGNWENSLIYETIVYYVPHFSIYFEMLLLFMVLWIIFKKNTHVNEEPPMSKEEKELIENYQPKQLVSSIDESHKVLNPQVVHSQVGKLIYINGSPCLNMATQNFHAFSMDPALQDKATDAVGKYGVGSCGPRGFYGTVDVHLDLEKKLAEFLSLEEAVVYSYGFSTVSSAIPAYSKKNDVIFTDECVNYAIQKGIEASRSSVYYFKHNNMDHLEELLMEDEKRRKKDGKRKKTRKFIVVEGIYQKTGLICPLDQVVELRKKYKARLFVDESISIGTIGKTGGGLREHFNIEGSEIDLIIGSLENSFGSVGGFCVGASFIVEHQRLSGLGYCFSASLPPLLTVVAIGALEKIKESPEMVVELQNKSQYCSDLLNKSNYINKYFVISGSDISPVKLLILKEDKYKDDIVTIVNRCLKHGIAFTVPSYLDNDVYKPSAIKISMNNQLMESDIKLAIETLERQVHLVID